MINAMRALKHLVNHAHRLNSHPDFRSLNRLLATMDLATAPNHHAREDAILFPLIAQRCPALGPVLERLQAERTRSELSALELEEALHRWGDSGATRQRTFHMLLRAHTTTYLSHIEVEEAYVLPVAMDYLTGRDWNDLEFAFPNETK